MPDQVSAEQVIVGYHDPIARAHARGVRVVGGTILPFKGAEHHTARSEAKRAAINAWIRVMASPSDPRALDPAYDSGDHKHPDDAGHRRRAEAIDLGAIRGHRGH